MGNDESCCEEFDQKKGEIESKVNSLKYSSIIYNTENAQRKENLKNTKNIFSNQMPQHEIQEIIQNHKNSKSVNSSRISNQEKMLPSKKAEHHQKFLQSFDQNPEKEFSVHPKDLKNEDIKYLEGSKVSQEYQRNSKIRSSIQGIDQGQGGRISRIQNPREKPSMRTAASTVEKELSIEYLPIVRKVIQRERPFEVELQQIPREKIKTRRINSNKDIYKGELNYFEKPHGYGVLAKQNGNVLIGKFDNGSINGLAYYIFSNGSYYDGKMVDNKANDEKGEFHSKPMSYIGGFKDNLFHGQGEYQNHRKKQGTLMWNTPAKTQEQNPEKSPESNISIPEEIQIPKVRRFKAPTEYEYVFQGTFDENQQFTGNGTLKEPHGEYKGQFFQGKKHGYGTYYFENKLRYIGDYKDNKKQGYGKLYNCDNSMAYQGFWKDNLPNGRGLSYGVKNKPMEMEFIQGISTILAPESQ